MPRRARLHAARWDEGPVLFVFRPGCNPLAQDFLLLRRNRDFRRRRRHHFVRVRGENALHQFALVRLPRHHRVRAGLRRRNRKLPPIEPQLALARLLIRPVALEAIARQNRAHLAGKVRHVRSEGRDGDESECDEFHKVVPLLNRRPERSKAVFTTSVKNIVRCKERSSRPFFAPYGRRISSRKKPFIPAGALKPCVTLLCGVSLVSVSPSVHGPPGAGALWIT